jgi:hypothetical protein
VVSTTAAASTSGRDLMLARLGPPLLVLLAVGVSLRPGLENDAWWHLASGRWMLEQRRWLEVDVFSWTVPGQPWPRPGLVADITMAWLHSFGGVPLLVTATAACFVATLVVLLLVVRASPLATFGVGALAVLTMVVAATPRPLVASLPLTALTVAVLDRERAEPGGSPVLWTLPVVGLVWVNTHGAFVVLFVLLGVHGLAVLIDGFRGCPSGWWRPFSRLVAVAVAAVVATLVNPFGWKMLLYPFETLRLEVLGEIIHEWRRPVLTDVQFWPLFALVGLSAVAAARVGARRRTIDVALLLVFGGLALTAARHGALFAIVAFPVVARLVSRRPPVPFRAAWVGARPQERTIEGAVLGGVGLLVAALVAPAMTVRGNQAAIEAWHGDRAAASVAEGDFPGRLWNSYDIGGYVIWHGFPDVPVSMDSRTDLYGDDLVREHFAEWHGERDAPARFREQGIATVLVERHAPLVAQLEQAGWSRASDAVHAVVLTRPGA